MSFKKGVPFLSTHYLVFVSFVFFLTACGGGGGSGNGGGGNNSPGVVGDGQLDEKLEAIRANHNVPALAAFVVQGNTISEISAQGLRSIDANVLTTTNDLWHLGSISKSMTATLAAFLVEQGHINWDSTIADVFPEWQGQILDKFLDIELQQLLSMISGLDRDVDTENPVFDDFDEDLLADDMGREARYEGGRLILSYDHSNPTGQFLYSNTGYIIAGAMLEKQMQQDWRSLIAQTVFSSLGITEFGFGPPGTDGLIDQPQGHAFNNGVHQPLYDDNPTYLDPAGRVHMPMESIALYAIFHLQGLRGEGQFLPGDTFSELYQSRSAGNYALGWVIDGSRISHGGSNSIWLAELVIDGDNNFAMFAVTNSYNSDAELAISETLTLLEGRIQ